MAGCEQSEMTIPSHFKQITCQASLCKHFKYPATCTADYLEHDEHGICIQFERKEYITRRSTGQARSVIEENETD